MPHLDLGDGFRLYYEVQKAASIDELSRRINGREPRLCRQRRNARCVGLGESVEPDEQRVGAPVASTREGGLKVFTVLHRQKLGFNTQGPCRHRHLPHLRLQTKGSRLGLLRVPCHARVVAADG